MNKKERVLAAIQGREVDRIPVSFYANNNLMERSAEYNAPYLLEKTLIYDWDFIKTQLNGYHYGQAWGCEFALDPQNRVDGAVTQIKKVISSVEDMKKLPSIDPAKNAFFAEQIRLAAMLHEGFKGELPFAQTVFCPLTVADILAGNMSHQKSSPQYVKTLMREAPDVLHQGLRTITETLTEYIRHCMRAGASGIYLATTHWACAEYMTLEDYKSFGLVYDLQLLEAARAEGAFLNMFHICRDNCFVAELYDCEPVDMFNYESTSPNNPDLAAMRALTKKAIWGGVDQRVVLQQGPEQLIEAQVHGVLDALDGRGILIGPGCTASPFTPPQFYFAARNAAHSWKNK